MKYRNFNTDEIYTLVSREYIDGIPLIKLIREDGLEQRWQLGIFNVLMIPVAE